MRKRPTISINHPEIEPRFGGFFCTFMFHKTQCLPFMLHKLQYKLTV
nr:MAG TPA: hypothetical protein [Caudoviricetes sp.]DAR38619.1 MAG TPA: hypothetical protein [Caudoviricetes sp.]